MSIFLNGNEVNVIPTDNTLWALLFFISGIPSVVFPSAWVTRKCTVHITLRPVNLLPLLLRLFFYLFMTAPHPSISYELSKEFCIHEALKWFLYAQWNQKTRQKITRNEDLNNQQTSRLNKRIHYGALLSNVQCTESHTSVTGSTISPFNERTKCNYFLNGKMTIYLYECFLLLSAPVPPTATLLAEGIICILAKPILIQIN